MASGGGFGLGKGMRRGTVLTLIGTRLIGGRLTMGVGLFEKVEADLRWGGAEYVYPVVSVFGGAT